MEVAADHQMARVTHLRARVNQALTSLVVEAEPARLYEPVRYVLGGAGKRLRPVMLILAAEMFGASEEQALPAALAVEVFHNFTLVHDDIMDHADERRGRPTVHEQWDQDTAILCGDYLLAYSYELLAQTETDSQRELIQGYSEMVRRLCEGQTLDKAFETRHDVSVEEYLHMIDCKTGALLRAVLEIGGRIGRASLHELKTLREIGCDVGRAFQIQDDLLDLVADDERWGKTIGGDLIEGKKTILLLKALERAEGHEKAWFARIVTDGGLPAEEVGEALQRMEQLGVISYVRSAVSEHTTRALAGLDSLPSSLARATLQWLIHRMQARLH